MLKCIRHKQNIMSKLNNTLSLIINITSTGSEDIKGKLLILNYPIYLLNIGGKEEKMEGIKKEITEELKSEEFEVEWIAQAEDAETYCCFCHLMVKI